MWIPEGRDGDESHEHCWGFRGVWNKDRQRNEIEVWVGCEANGFFFFFFKEMREITACFILMEVMKVEGEKKRDTARERGSKREAENSDQ